MLHANKSNESAGQSEKPYARSVRMVTVGQSADARKKSCGASTVPTAFTDTQNRVSFSANAFCEGESCFFQYSVATILEEN